MVKMSTREEVEALIKGREGIRLDVGGGNSPNHGFVNMDIQPLPKVDIVWDIEKTPWPLPDESVLIATASHVLEHINPHAGDKRLQGLVDLLLAKKVFTQQEADDYLGQPGPAFINVMNEIWRVLKPNGQFAFVVPYAENFGMYQDPTHINFINEATMTYFDPLHPSQYYQFYQPKPWKIIKQPFSRTGVLECLLEKRLMDKSYLNINLTSPDDITRENLSVQTIRTDF